MTYAVNANQPRIYSSFQSCRYTIVFPTITVAPSDTKEDILSGESSKSFKVLTIMELMTSEFADSNSQEDYQLTGRGL